MVNASLEVAIDDDAGKEVEGRVRRESSGGSAADVSARKAVVATGRRVRHHLD